MLIVAAICAGCTIGPEPAPTSPPTTPVPPQPTTGSPPPFPAVSDAAAIYKGPDNLYDVFVSLHGSSIPSRYVLKRDGTFELQFSSYRIGIFRYPGTYTRADSVITFTWGDSYIAAPWGAVGVMHGDSLNVQYNINMSMSDFIDGVYVIVR